MPYPATLIAYAFVKKGIEDGAPVTQMKLQKMVYFAQGIHLAVHGVPLIDDIIQAWKYGPVIPSIYQAYKSYGSSKITDTYRIMGKYNDVELLYLDNITKNTIDYTWSELKDTDVNQLTNWTHREGSPWKQIFREGVSEIVIPNSSIQKYFEQYLGK